MGGDGETTGLLTGVDRFTIDRVRAELAALGQFARSVESELEGTVRPTVADAEIGDWVSTGRLAYDGIRWALECEIAATAGLAASTAATFEGLETMVLIETAVQFP